MGTQKNSVATSHEMAKALNKIGFNHNRMTRAAINTEDSDAVTITVTAYLSAEDLTIIGRHFEGDEE